jgi:hypothetical protein
VPPQFHIYGRVTNAAGDAVAGAPVTIQVSVPRCGAETYRSFGTTTDEAGVYHTEPFDAIFADLCIVVESLQPGSPGPPTQVVRELMISGSRDDSVGVDVELP